MSQHAHDRIENAMQAWIDARQRLLQAYEDIDEIKKTMASIQAFLEGHGITRTNGKWRNETIINAAKSLTSQEP